MKFSLVSVAAVLAIASSASAVMPRSAIVGTHRRQSASTNSRDVLNDALRSEGQDSKAVSLNLRGGDEGAAGLMQTLKVGFYFGLWYALNIVYNSKSKLDSFFAYMYAYHVNCTRHSIIFTYSFSDINHNQCIQS